MEVLEKELNCFVALPIQTCTDSLPNLSSYFSSDGEVSTEDLLERLLAAWDTHPVHGKILFDAYSFDLWDLLHQRTFTSSSEEETSSFWELQIRFTRRLSQSVSAKEFKIMFLEKLHLQNWTYIGVRWYCYVCQLYLVGGNAVVKREDEDLQAVQGMLAIFNAFFQTEGEPQSRPFLVGLSFDILYMLHGVACLHTEWTDRISATDTICALKQTSSSLHQIVLQWLYTTAADFAVMYLDDDMHSRDVWCHEAVLLWQYLLDYQMQDVLCFHRQIKYQISVDLKAKTASFESSVDGIKQINKLQEMLQRDCGNHRNVANTVSKYLEANSASIQTEDVLVSTETLINLCSPEVHVLHSSSKQPVLGLVLLLQHWLFYALYSSASSTSSFSYSPLGLHRSLLEESYQEVLKCLLSINKLAAKEGLRALVCLYPTKGRLEDMLTYLPTSGRTGQVFLSSGLTLSMEELYQEYFALLRCPRSVDLDRKVALHLVSMQSSQTWHTMQCLVTAITMCQDSALRSQAFHAWKCYLMQWEAWCLFELLFQLIKQCPYESMRAMLFEVVKAVLQVQASAQHTQNTEMAMRTKKMSTVAKTKLFRSEVQAIDTASQLLASLQPAVFDVRSVASRYSSLTSSSFHQAIFSPSSSSLAIATIFFSPVGMEYFLLHFMRDCCLESFVGDVNRLEEVNIQVNILQFIFAKLQASESEAFFSQEDNIGIRESQVLLDTLVILHDMLQQIERYHIDKVVVQEELQHKMKVDLLQLNVRLVMDRLVTIIQTLL